MEFGPEETNYSSESRESDSDVSPAEDDVGLENELASPGARGNAAQAAHGGKSDMIEGGAQVSVERIPPAVPRTSDETLGSTGGVAADAGSAPAPLSPYEKQMARLLGESRRNSRN